LPGIARSPSTAWSLLRRRPVFLLWLGMTLSTVGDWVLLVALPVHVYTLTGSSAATAGAFLFELVPRLVLGSPLGTLTDRFDRRRVVAVCSLVQAAVLAPVATVHGADRLWLIFLCAAALGVLSNLALSATRALMADVVAAEDLAGAVSLTGLSDNLGRLAGAPLGGAIVGLAGIGAVVAIDVASFLAVALCAALLGGRARAAGAERAQAPVPGALRAWLEGLRVVAARRELRVATAILAVGAVAQGMFVVLFVVWVSRELGGGGEQIGLLRGVQAAGGLVGAVLVAGVAHRTRPTWLMGGGALAFGVISLALWNAPVLTTAPAVYAGGFVLAGLPGAAFVTGGLTVLQLEAAAGERGRVLSTVMAVEDGMQALGVALAGLLAALLPVVAVFSLQALLWIAAGVLSLGLLDRAGRRLRAQPSAARQGDRAGYRSLKLARCPA
jgi:MFS family permease